MTLLPKQVLPQTQQLIMTGNYLGIIESITQELAGIKHWGLQENKIIYVEENALKILLLNANILILSKNKMNKISSLFQSQNTKTKLWLGHNPYDCNCDMMWMRDWLQNATNVMDKENITCTGGKWDGKVFSALVCIHTVFPKH